VKKEGSEPRRGRTKRFGNSFCATRKIIIPRKNGRKGTRPNRRKKRKGRKK
jgi:hypothetical protein